MAGNSKTVKTNSLGMILLKGRTFSPSSYWVIFFSFCAPNFTTLNSILLLLRHTSLYGLLALGMTLRHHHRRHRLERWLRGRPGWRAHGRHAQ